MILPRPPQKWSQYSSHFVVVDAQIEKLTSERDSAIQKVDSLQGDIAKTRESVAELVCQLLLILSHSHKTQLLEESDETRQMLEEEASLLRSELDEVCRSAASTIDTYLSEIIQQ